MLHFSTIAHVQSDCKPPGEASRTAGIAALTRLESNEKPETIVKPILRMDMKSSTTFSHEMTKDKQYQVMDTVCKHGANYICKDLHVSQVQVLQKMYKYKLY